jgi:ubiquitin-conjugating enzyme E2 variant
MRIASRRVGIMLEVDGLHRALEATALCSCAVLAAWLAGRLAVAADSPGGLACVAAGLGLGLLGADLASGLVHWWADRLASVATPWLGAHVVRPFREHHVDPRAIVAHGFVETNGNSCLAALPVLAATFGWLPGDPRGLALLAGAASWALAVFACLTNQVHKWAHTPSPPRAVRALQRAGLLLGPDRHAQHHVPPFDRRYCITTGWLGPALDACGLLSWLERRRGSLR